MEVKRKMVEHKTEMSGRAMAVIVGAICLIAPWFSQIGFLSKVGIALVGAFLVYLGTR
jgi:hypothetical protein